MNRPKIPVFDIGDTLLPDRRLMNEAVEEILREEGNQGIPRFPIHEYNIFRPQEVKKFLYENDLQANPVDVRKRYEKKAARFLAEKDVLATLDRCSQEIGSIGFISDNAVKEKEFMQERLRKHHVEYKGFVVSEEVGSRKPGKEIFRSFLNIREERPEKFVYFGNDVSRDQAAKKTGMEFVWVKQYNTFGSKYEGKQIEELSFENIRRFCQ